jgi:hypothetical protein
VSELQAWTSLKNLEKFTNKPTLIEHLSQPSEPTPKTSVRELPTTGGEDDDVQWLERWIEIINVSPPIPLYHSDNHRSVPTSPDKLLYQFSLVQSMSHHFLSETSPFQQQQHLSTVPESATAYDPRRWPKLAVYFSKLLLHKTNHRRKKVVRGKVKWRWIECCEEENDGVEVTTTADSVAISSFLNLSPWYHLLFRVAILVELLQNTAMTTTSQTNSPQIVMWHHIVEPMLMEDAAELQSSMTIVVVAVTTIQHQGSVNVLLNAQLKTLRQSFIFPSLEIPFGAANECGEKHTTM